MVYADISTGSAGSRVRKVHDRNVANARVPKSSNDWARLQGHICNHGYPGRESRGLPAGTSEGAPNLEKFSHPSW